MNKLKRIFFGIVLIISIVIGTIFFTSCVVSAATIAVDVADLQENSISNPNCNATTDKGKLNIYSETTESDILEENIQTYLPLETPATETEKEEILYKILNTVDYYSDISGIFYYITKGATTITIKSVFNISMDGEQYISMEKNITEMEYKNLTDNWSSIVIALDTKLYNFNEKKMVCFENDLDNNNRLLTVSESNISASNLTKNSSFNHVLISNFLSGNNNWDIVGESVLFDKECSVIKGTLAGDYSKKYDVVNFVTDVDKDTGIILNFVGYNAQDEITFEMKFEKFSYSSSLSYVELKGELQSLITLYDNSTN